ncbi:hypothetical protein LOK49_LG02G00576 [Camellia lanceoleosa]|uniref:Uncharacterized protein n=1 Tax=Camellia lanceoleosa TaxID=1840588 RepID=A0ACC0IPI1_9ERIC|nr:hypothetical protein LOK49_LG02G00576 [Camellia lanceoleosa]
MGQFVSTVIASVNRAILLKIAEGQTTLYNLWWHHAFAALEIFSLPKDTATGSTIRIAEQSELKLWKNLEKVLGANRNDRDLRPSQLQSSLKQFEDVRKFCGDWANQELCQWAY